MSTWAEKRAARRYWHVMPHRPCWHPNGFWYSLRAGPCLRCMWREATGVHRREKRRMVEAGRERLASMPMPSREHALALRAKPRPAPYEPPSAH